MLFYCFDLIIQKFLQLEKERIAAEFEREERAADIEFEERLTESLDTLIQVGFVA